MGNTAIEVPEDILDSARMTPQELRTELAVHLYARGRLSLGKARELAGLSPWEFRQFLGSRQVEPHYGLEELEDDVATLGDLKAR